MLNWTIAIGGLALLSIFSDRENWIRSFIALTGATVTLGGIASLLS